MAAAAATAAAARVVQTDGTAATQSSPQCDDDDVVGCARLHVIYDVCHVCTQSVQNVWEVDSQVP